MKIFILGETHSGKSTLAKYISDLKGYDVVSAGFYMKENYPQLKGESKQAWTDRLTNQTMTFLKKNPSFFSDKIKERIDQTTSKNVIIEGIRNPRDFAILFEPGRDVIITTMMLNTDIKVSNNIEQSGLHVIHEMIKYFDLIKKSTQFKVFMSKTISIDQIMSNNPPTTKWWNKKFYEYINKAH